MKFKSDIQAESKVGIGTDTVNYPLDVRAGSANSDVAQFTGANDSRGLKISTFQRFSADDSVDYDCQFSGAAPILPGGAQTWSMSGNEKMRLTQDGTLGIGTTSPIDPLVVRNGTSDTNVKILSFNSTAGTEAILKFSTFASETNHVKAAIIARNAAGSFGRSDMHFALDSAADTSNVQFSDTKMTILNGGNVGIGTTGPGSRLEVAGEIDATTGDGYYINGKPWANQNANVLNLGDWDGQGFSTIIYDENSRGVVKIKEYGTMINCSFLNSTYGSRASLAVGTVGDESAGAGVITLVNNDTSGSAGDPTGKINFAIKDDGANTLGYTSAIIQGSIFAAPGQANSGGGILDFKTSQDTSGTSPQTRIRINQLGNVGIGTTSPGAKLDVDGNIIVSGGVSNEDTGVRVTNPGGASFITQSSSIAGAIKITLPQGGVNTMIRMEVKVYEYLTNESFTVQCGGYLNTGNSWFNEYAYIESSAKDDRNFTVRFGYNGSKGVIYIGELSSFWGYPQVFVTEFQGGFQNPTALNYQDGWDVSFETTSFLSVTQTQTGTQINNWARSGTDTYYASSTGNVGIGDTTPSYKLDVTGEGRFTGDLRCLSLIQTSQSDKKESISDIVKTTNKKIEFKEYVYKSDSGNRKRYGVLAEDIEVDYPELVHVDADGVKGVNYIDLLVKRVAELEKELEDISLTEGPKGDTGSRGLRGYTGTSGSSGTNGADGKDGNSHLSDVSSIGFNEKSGQLEIRIGRETYRFNQDK